MVAQQLTPELTQPNVLVEIDPGPTMGPYQETQRRVPERYLPESMSITDNASASKSTFSSTELRGGALWVSGKPGSGKLTLMKYIADESITYRFITAWARFSRPQLTILDTGEETAFIGMHLNRFIEDDNKQGAEPSPMVDRPPSRWGLPEGEGNRPLSLFKVAHTVVPSLPSKEKDWAKTIGGRGWRQRSLAQDWVSASGDPKSLLSLTDQGGAASRDCALENRHRSFNGDSNVDNEPVTHEKKMARDDKSAVIGKSNAFQTESPTRSFRTRRFQAQTTGQENIDDVELPFSMSCRSSDNTDVNFDVGCIESEILMWMIEYNLVSYSASWISDTDTADT